MFDYSESPPPLHHSPATSDKARFPSRDSTPATPVGFGPSAAKRPDKDRDPFLPWFKKPLDIGKATTSLCLDSTLLEPDFDDHSFPLFGSSPPDRSMAGAAAPIDIATRQASTSPRGHQASNLTSALQRTQSSEERAAAAAAANLRGTNVTERDRADSAGDGLSQLENGARPISMRGPSSDKPRRESIAQSLNTGMSWGGISVGSWIRDEYVTPAMPQLLFKFNRLFHLSRVGVPLTVQADFSSVMMSGTSPFTFHQSPSYHSSSYLPKLEANFMRDFSCCGLTLPSLHDLLQHYEEAHAQKTSQPHKASAAGAAVMPDSRAAIATNTAASVQQQAQQQHQQQLNNFKPIAPAQSIQQNALNQQAQQRPPGFTSTLQTIPDMDTVEDMEMDDVEDMDGETPPPNLYTQPNTTQSPRTQFNSPAQPRVPQLNMNMMQAHQGLRNSTPSTPIAQGRPAFSLQNNPTVSSVNTPTLMANPMQQQFQDPSGQYRETPDSSAPGTPGELEDGIVGGMDEMSMQNNPLLAGNQNQNYPFAGFGMNNDMLDLCIDEPAKRLFSPNGGYGNQSQQYTHSRLGSGQYGPNSDIARRIREQQMLAGVPDTSAGMMPHDEPKPFRCPVIGCEKAYKNQNGLKYHKSVSCTCSSLCHWHRLT